MDINKKTQNLENKLVDDVKYEISIKKISYLKMK